VTAGSGKRTLITAPVLAGPGSGLIRSGGPDDADAIRAFVCSLSPRSLYFRFFASVSPPSTGLLRALCGVTGAADILLLTDSRDAIIGHAMAADGPARDGGRDTNIGLMIADDWQGQGLGSTLLTVLVSRAARRGVRGLVLDVLPDNNPMRGLIRRRWPDAPAERTRDALVFRPPIGPADAIHLADLPAVLSLRHHSTTTCTATRAATHTGGSRAPDRSAA